MNGDIVRRDRNGVLLRYSDPAVRRAHHDLRGAQPADCDRTRLIEAERELLRLYVIWECSDFPEFAINRIEYALEAIRMGLQVKRRQFGMPAVEGGEAA